MEIPQSIKEEAKAFAKTDCYDDPIVDGKMTNYPYTNKEKYEAYIAGRLASQKEIEELREWKRQAIEVMPPLQEIGKATGVKLGESIHDKILPYIEKQHVKLEEKDKRIKELEDMITELEQR